MIDPTPPRMEPAICPPRYFSAVKSQNAKPCIRGSVSLYCLQITAVGPAAFGEGRSLSLCLEGELGHSLSTWSNRERSGGQGGGRRRKSKSEGPVAPTHSFLRYAEAALHPPPLLSGGLLSSPSGPSAEKVISLIPPRMRSHCLSTSPLFLCLLTFSHNAVSTEREKRKIKNADRRQGLCTIRSADFPEALHSRFCAVSPLGCLLLPF